MLKRLLTVTVALLSLCTFAGLQASDHLDAPILTGAGHLDINDLYAFQSPNNADNTVLILTVNPFAGSLSGTLFGTTDVVYEFQVDNNGDAVPDVTYGATFAMNGGGQDITLTRNGTPVATGSTGGILSVTGGGMVQAGVFDDPFFFDLAGFRDGFNFTGVDAFAGANVSAIVLEIPSSELGASNVGIAARSLSGGNQVDRVGRPAINTALIPSGRKDAFNQGLPSQDTADFADDVRTSILSLNGNDTAHAATLTGILLPDLLTIDTSSADPFLNGRKLADDVIDAELNLLSKGAVTGDMVNGNDAPFGSSFPYLAPQNIPEPSGIVLAAFGFAALCRTRGRSQRNV